jgi:hypothetical protein
MDMDKGRFWLGVAQHSLGHLMYDIIIRGTALLLAAGIIAYSRAKLMHTSLGIAFYIFLEIIGVALLVLSLFLICRLILGTSTNAEIQLQRLTIRITDGVVGILNNDTSTLVIYLFVHVDGPPALIGAWTLMLWHGEKSFWRAAYYTPPTNSDAFIIRLSGVGVERRDHTIPRLSDHVPDKGWLRFVLMQSGNPNDTSHIFGVTFNLLATEETGEVSEVSREPGEWLSRASEISEHRES